MSTGTLGASQAPNLFKTLGQNKLSWVGAAVLLLIVLAALFAPLLAPYDPLQQHILKRLQPPSQEFWFGTDTFGRDVFSRILYGARVSLTVAFLSILTAAVIGTIIGVTAGYLGGLFDKIVSSLLDVMLSFPTLLLGLMVAAMLGASLENLIIAIAITEIAPFARVARAPSISLKTQDFVDAGRALGFSHMRIIGVHIVPNMISGVVVTGSLWMASAIRTEAGLSFIGLGVPPPAATWGGIIREGFENILTSWWLVVFPSLAILLTVLAVNLIGDALRDAIDPKMKAR